MAQKSTHELIGFVQSRLCQVFRYSYDNAQDKSLEEMDRTGFESYWNSVIPIICLYSRDSEIRLQSSQDLPPNTSSRGLPCFPMEPERLLLGKRKLTSTEAEYIVQIDGGGTVVKRPFTSHSSAG